MQDRDNAFYLPIRIEYSPPGWLFLVLTFSHGGALVCLFSAGLPVCIQGMFTVVVLVSYMRMFLEFVKYRLSEQKPQLLLDRKDAWSLLTIDADEAISLHLQSDALVHRLLVVLRFISESGTSHTFILGPENVEQHTLRRLRVRLLHGRANT